MTITFFLSLLLPISMSPHQIMISFSLLIVLLLGYQFAIIYEKKILQEAIKTCVIKEFFIVHSDNLKIHHAILCKFSRCLSNKKFI